MLRTDPASAGDSIRDLTALRCTLLVTLALLSACGGDERSAAADERSATEVARAHVGTRDAATTEATARVEGHRATVTIEFDRLRDDSVRAERHVVTLERDDGEWRVVGEEVTYRCQEGRGHQDFSEELCL